METPATPQRNSYRLKDELRHAPRMLHHRHREGLLSKPYQAGFHRGLRGTRDFTSGDVWHGSGTRISFPLKGAAIRFFQQPFPVPCALFMQLSGLQRVISFSCKGAVLVHPGGGRCFRVGYRAACNSLVQQQRACLLNQRDRLKPDIMCDRT